MMASHASSVHVSNIRMYQKNNKLNEIKQSKCVVVLIVLYISFD